MSDAGSAQRDEFGPSDRVGAFGPWPAVELANHVVRIVVVPSLGGRVVSLLDRRTGREWLLQGAPPSAAEGAAWARDDAVFGGREAFGWDECLPTVAPCPDPRAPAGPPLRDHGTQWGRPAPASVGQDGDSLRIEWTDDRWPFRFTRTLRLAGSIAVAGYAVANTGSDPLTFLWSMHTLLDLEPGARIHLPAGARMSMPFATGAGLAPAPVDRLVVWPDAEGEDGPVDLSLVRPVRPPMAAKLYADPAPPGPVRAVTPDGASIAFDWSRELAPALGLWLDFGAWPGPGDGIRQVAIEPTTSGHDDLAGAIADGRASRVGEGETVAWEVRISVDPPR